MTTLESIQSHQHNEELRTQRSEARLIAEHNLRMEVLKAKLDYYKSQVPQISHNRSNSAGMNVITSLVGSADSNTLNVNALPQDLQFSMVPGTAVILLTNNVNYTSNAVRSSPLQSGAMQSVHASQRNSFDTHEAMHQNVSSRTCTPVGSGNFQRNLTGTVHMQSFSNGSQSNVIQGTPIGSGDHSLVTENVTSNITTPVPSTDLQRNTCSAQSSSIEETKLASWQTTQYTISDSLESKINEIMAPSNSNEASDAMLHSDNSLN